MAILEAINPMRSFVKVFAFAFCFGTSLAAHAQLGLYGQFSTSTVSTVNTPRLYGGTFGAFYDSRHFPVVNFGIDARGSIQRATQNGTETSATSVTAGPRVVFHLPPVPLRPYGEVLVGGGHLSAGQGLAANDHSGFAASAVAGADLHLLPYIDWRVIDFSFSRVPHANQNSVSTGLVIRIPFS